MTTVHWSVCLNPSNLTILCKWGFHSQEGSVCIALFQDFWAALLFHMILSWSLALSVKQGITYQHSSINAFHEPRKKQTFESPCRYLSLWFTNTLYQYHKCLGIVWCLMKPMLCFHECHIMHVKVWAVMQSRSKSQVDVHKDLKHASYTWKRAAWLIKRSKIFKGQTQLGASFAGMMCIQRD